MFALNFIFNLLHIVFHTITCACEIGEPMTKKNMLVSINVITFKSITNRNL